MGILCAEPDLTLDIVTIDEGDRQAMHILEGTCPSCLSPLDPGTQKTVRLTRNDEEYRTVHVTPCTGVGCDWWYAGWVESGRPDGVAVAGATLERLQREANETREPAGERAPRRPSVQGTDTAQTEEA